jgi:DNA-binding response OmpR family regulator
MPQNPIKLLLVDDEEDAFVLLRGCLSEIRGTKYKLDWVPTVDEGKDWLKRQEHDVFLVDYQLGAHEGTELLLEARALGVTTPIIMLTGMGLHEVDVECMKLGAADYLNKDFLYASILERVVRYALERQKMQEKLTQQLAYRERTQTLLKIADQFQPCSEAIARMAQLLAATPLSDEQGSYVKAIQTASTSITRLTEEAQRSARIEELPLQKERAA